MATFSDTADAKSVLDFALARLKARFASSTSVKGAADGEPVETHSQQVLKRHLPDDPFTDDDAQALIDAQGS